MHRFVLAAGSAALFTAAGLAAAQTSASPPPATEPGRLVLGAEALATWFKDSPVPAPLVTDGFVGQAATRVFLGSESADTGTHSGIRIGAAYGLGSGAALEGNFFYVGSRSTGSAVNSSGKASSIDLILPYVDAVTKRETGTELSVASYYAGQAQLSMANELLGAEINGAWVLPAATGWRLDALGGFRYLRLRETLTLATSSPYVPPYPKDIWETVDQFQSTNNFYGAQAGLRAAFGTGPVSATATAKLALGAMVQTTDIGGSLVTNDFTNYGATQTFAGGYFALPSNLGSHTSTRFAVVPEVAASVAFELAPGVRLLAGYSFLYASTVQRPGDQIDRTINPSQSVAHTENPTPTLQGPAQPTAPSATSAFWAQSLAVGLAIRF